MGVLEDKVMETTQAEEQKKKKKKRNENRLRELWDNTKHPNIHTTEVREEEERETVVENLFEEIIAKNFPNLEKERDIHVQKAKRAPEKINSRRFTKKHC